MSGGVFDFDQHRIDNIAESIRSIIDKNKVKIKDPESWEPEFYYEFPDDIIDKFKEGILILKQAACYAQRIDYLISGDDGEETFKRRLKEELNKIDEEFKYLK